MQKFINTIIPPCKIKGERLVVKYFPKRRNLSVEKREIELLYFDLSQGCLSLIDAMIKLRLFRIKEARDEKGKINVQGLAVGHRNPSDAVDVRVFSGSPQSE
jgi:hypothetical protein